MVPKETHPYSISVDDFLRMDFSKEDALDRAAKTAVKAFSQNFPKDLPEQEPLIQESRKASKAEEQKKDKKQKKEAKDSSSNDSFTELLESKKDQLSENRKKLLRAAMIDGRSEAELKFLLEADDNKIKTYLALSPLNVSSMG